MKDVWKVHQKWADATFGKDRDPVGPLKHMLKEVEECKETPDDIVEYADCLLLLFDAARLRGMSLCELELPVKIIGIEKNQGDTYLLDELADHICTTIRCLRDTALSGPHFRRLGARLMFCVHNAGFSYSELRDAALAKMEVNKAREWPKPIQGEPCLHVK